MRAETKIKFTAALLLLTALSPPAYAEQCQISQQKRSIIYDFLCGKYSREPHYVKAGPGCVRASTRVQLNDTARHIVGLKLCGHESIIPAYIQSVKEIQSINTSLSSCTPEQFAPGEIDDLFQTEMKKVERRARGATCITKLRDKITRRLPFFMNTIEQVKDGSLERALSATFGITILSDGSVIEE